MSSFKKEKKRQPYKKYIAVSDNINILTVVSQFIVLAMIVMLVLLPIFGSSDPSVGTFSYFDDSEYLRNIAKDFIVGNLEHSSDPAYKIEFPFSCLQLLTVFVFIIEALLLVLAVARSIAGFFRSKTDAMLKYHKVKNLSYLSEKAFSKRRTIRDFFVLLICMIGDIVLFRFGATAGNTSATVSAADFTRKMASLSIKSLNIPLILVFLALFVLYIIIVLCIKGQEKKMISLLYREETLL